MATNWKSSLEALKLATVSSFTQVRTKMQTIITRLNAHTEATGNVHNLTPTHLGIGNVADHPPATQLQAEDGTNNATNMTPLRTKQWAETNVYYPIAKAFGDAADKL